MSLEMRYLIFQWMFQGSLFSLHTLLTLFFSSSINVYVVIDGFVSYAFLLYPNESVCCTRTCYIGMFSATSTILNRCCLIVFFPIFVFKFSQISYI